MISFLPAKSNCCINFCFAVLLMLMHLGFQTTQAQHKIIPLYEGAAPGSEHWTWKEGETNNTPMKTRIIYNVTRPALLAYLPDAAIANGTAVIIITGGGGRVILIDKEGTSIAENLVKKGITVFILKHRLAQSKTNDPWTEMMISLKDTAKRDTSIRQLARYDLATALKHVREYADDYKIDRNKVGLIGFSAGAAMSAHMIYNGEHKPDFAALNYGVYRMLKDWPSIKSTIPIFIAAATDDQLAPVAQSISLYNHWIASKNSAELHVYAKGSVGIPGLPNHGLNAIPANAWIARFVEWMEAMGIIK